MAKTVKETKGEDMDKKPLRDPRFPEWHPRNNPNLPDLEK